jgi:hypothetical protein
MEKKTVTGKEYFLRKERGQGVRLLLPIIEWNRETL